MKKRLLILKKNLPIILIGAGVLVIIIVLTIIFTNLNPIIIGSASGIALSLIIPAIIYRINVKNIDSNRNDEKILKK